jgi:hypothetical protein
MLQIIGGQGLGMSHAFTKQLAEGRVELDEVEERRGARLKGSQTAIYPISMEAAEERRKKQSVRLFRSQDQ